MNTSIISVREQELLRDLAALQLWHVGDLCAREGRPIEDCLRRQTTILALLPRLWDGGSPDVPAADRPLWRHVSETLASAWRRHAAARTTPYFIAEATAWVHPLLVHGALEQAANSTETWFGCFRYQPDAQGAVVHLHFRNACCPVSPFADRPRLVGTIRVMLDDIAGKGLNPLRVACGSWINNLRLFQALFPPAYKDSLVPTSPEERTGNGWWGQFIDRQGLLHRPRADLLRNEHRFEFPRLHGECRFEEFRCHVCSEGGAS